LPASAFGRRIGRRWPANFGNTARRTQSPTAGRHRSARVSQEGYEVEFATLTGQTVAVVIVLAGQVRPVSRRDLTHVRELVAA